MILINEEGFFGINDWSSRVIKALIIEKVEFQLLWSWLMEIEGSFLCMILKKDGIFWYGLEESYSWWWKEKGHFYKKNDSKYGLDDFL